MSYRHSSSTGALLFVALGVVGAAGQQAPGRGQGAGGQAPGTPTRDTSAQQPAQTAAPAATGRITGRVVAADTGRPIGGARVSLSAAQVGGGLSMVTGTTGTFDFTALPEARYTLSVSKTGFVTLAYGQRRPLQPGTPLQLASGQRLEGIELRLPRGSAIAGHVLDENGDPMPGATVRVMRYQYTQGQRTLAPAGSGQTDDKGQYRVWGLNPGDYYVSAVMPNLGALVNAAGINVAGRGGRAGGPAGRGGDPAQGGAGGGRGGRGVGAGAGGIQGVLGAGGGRAAILAGGSGLSDALAAPGDALALAGLGGNIQTLFDSLDSNGEPIAYAPTYYPGVSSPTDARPITVALSAEALDIDFSLLLVRTSRISGRVTSSDGSPAASGNVNLIPDEPNGGAGRGGGPFSGNYASRMQQDGTFIITNVPPGRYILRARSDAGGGRGGGGGGGRGGAGGGRGGAPGAPGGAAPNAPLAQFASQQITVGGDMTDINVVLADGATIHGSVVLQTAQSARPPNLTQIRVIAQAEDPSLGTNFNASVDQDGHFTLDGVPAGTHWLRAQAPRGLALKSVTIGGRDTIDEPYEVRSGETIDGVNLVFTDKVSEINGTITDDRGVPITDYTVLAYPEDARLWRPQARQIMTARPDQNGKFQIRGLPPGRYYLATVDPTVNGEWFEPKFLEQHRDAAAHVSLGEGEVKTQDFKMR